MAGGNSYPFAIGDRIQNIADPKTHTNGGKTGTVTKIDYHNNTVFVEYDDGNTGNDTHPWDDYKKIESRLQKTKQTFMEDLREKFTMIFKSEPLKTFRKAGIVNGDDFLTSEGQDIFLAFLLKKHGEEFKTEVVDQLLKDKETKE